MLLPHHTHICQECGNETIYHIHPNENKGDTVNAFCGNCDEDTDHTIGEYEGNY